MSELQLIHNPLVQPISVADAAGQWATIENQNKQAATNAAQEQRLTAAAPLEQQTNQLKFNAMQHTALKSIATDFKTNFQNQAAKLKIDPNSEQGQQLANSLYANGGYNETFRNITGKTYQAGTNIDLKAIDALAGSTPSEENAQQLQQKVAEAKAVSGATLPDRLEIANATAGLAQQGRQQSFDNSIKLQDHQSELHLTQLKTLADEKKANETPYSDDAQMMLAIGLNHGQTLPRNLGKDATKKAIEMATKIRLGLVDENDLLAQAHAKSVEGTAEAASLKTQVAQENYLKNAHDLFAFNLSKVRELGKSMGNDISPILSEQWQKGIRNINISPEEANKLAAFDTFKSAMDAEFSRLTKSSPTGAGTPTQTERDHDHELIRSAHTWGQMDAALNAMEQDSNERLRIQAKTKAETMAKLGGKAAPQKITQQAPAGTRAAIDSNGNTVYVRIK